MKKKIGLLVAIIISCLFLLPVSVLADTTVSARLDGVVSYYQENKTELEHWEEVVGLAGAGQDVTKHWKVPDWELSKLDAATDYASRILGILASGGNPADIQSRNLVEELKSKQLEDGSFDEDWMNQTVWAVMALDTASADYELDKAIKYILDQQMDDGGFGWGDGNGDVDLTGMTLMALSPYRDHPEVEAEVRAKVGACIEKAVDFLDKAQLDTGGFGSIWSGENLESTAVVIRGLLSCGEDITKWESLLDRFFDFQLEDYTFSHVIGGKSNAISTRQGLIALADMVHGNVLFNIREGRLPGTTPEPETVTVRVRVEGQNQGLVDKRVEVAGSALDALRLAVGSDNVEASGGFITSIMGETGGSVTENIDLYWLYYVIRNNAFDEVSQGVGAADYLVCAGDEIVFYIGAFGATYLPVVQVSPPSPVVDQQITITIAAQKYIWGSGLEELTPKEKEAIGEYLLTIGDQQYTSQEGKVIISGLPAGEETFVITNSHKGLYPDVVTWRGAIKVLPRSSGNGGSKPFPNYVTVQLVVEKGSQTLYDGPINIPVDGDWSQNAFAALVLSGLDIEYQYGGAFVTCIGGYRNEGPGGWSYSVNDYIPDVAAIDIPISQGDRIRWYWVDSYQENLPEETMPPSKLEEPEREQVALYVNYLQNLSERFDSDQIAAMCSLINADCRMSYDEARRCQEGLDRNLANFKKRVGDEEELVADPAEEISILVPPLSTSMNLEVNEVVPVRSRLLLPDRWISSVFELTGDQENLEQPLLVMIKFAPLEGLELTRLTPAWYDEKKQEWVPLSGIIDLKEGIVAFHTSRSGRYALLQTPVKMSFSDVDESLKWGKSAIEELAGDGLLSGTGTGFEPQRSVTRAEFVQMLVKAMHLTSGEQEKAQFNDVTGGDWFAPAVNTAVSRGLVSGYPDGYYYPFKELTRQEAAVIMARLDEEDNLDPTLRPTFADRDQIPAWAVPGVRNCQAWGLLSGYPDNTFRGEEKLSRAEAAVLVFNYRNHLLASYLQ